MKATISKYAKLLLHNFQKTISSLSSENGKKQKIFLTQAMTSLPRCVPSILIGILSVCSNQVIFLRGKSGMTWWWSSSQRTRLLLWRSEFKSRWTLKILRCWMDESKQKRGQCWRILWTNEHWPTLSKDWNVVRWNVTIRQVASKTDLTRCLSLHRLFRVSKTICPSNANKTSIWTFFVCQLNCPVRN